MGDFLEALPPGAVVTTLSSEFCPHPTLLAVLTLLHLMRSLAFLGH